jgi:RimJ/RimL family protein N-acetyltransferase
VRNYRSSSEEVIEYNTSGIRTYEKVGFQKEGRKRSVVYSNGIRYDIIVMGILRTKMGTPSINRL